MKRLLLEVGAEEIPAGYIEPALSAMKDMMAAKLDKARIDHGDIRIYGTPRHLAVIVDDVGEHQKSVTEDVMGPPVKVAFDADNKPTVAAEKFALKVGVSVDALSVKETEKGAYLFASVTEEGKDTLPLLSEMLPDVILSTPFPKSMKWGSLHIQYARPIFSILALFGNEVVPFAVGNIESGNFTFGHPFTNPTKVIVNHPDEYLDKLKAVNVYADLEERKEDIRNKIDEIAKSSGGTILPDEELLDIVKNLVELPVPVMGKFEDKYLEVPDEILITAMRKHQKYFAIIDDNKRLMPCFIALNNTPVKNEALVINGHERVLRARLEDARYFYKNDVNESMDNWVEKLKAVTFQAKLGSVYDKTKRVQALAEYIADQLKDQQDADLKSKVARAAVLTKADLVSQVVYEFTELQGVMGRIYAEKAGEDKDVAAAIEEHYMPTQSGGKLPETMTGAIVSIAEKIDSICGCFAIDLIPTGASDPYALRRQGIGVIQIMREKNFTFSLKAVIDKSLEAFAEKAADTGEKVFEFITNRISNLLLEDNCSKDVIAAVVSASVDHVPNIWKRARALESLKSAPDFEPLAVAFKRVVNIIKKADPKDIASDVSDALFEKYSESGLLRTVSEIGGKVGACLAEGRFDEALKDIASMRNMVDAFFDDVMVMVDDAGVRGNRLALLKKISDLFDTIADFSKIST